MAEKVLTTPISAEDLEDIHVGDVIYLTGELTTCRDVAHRRVIEEKRPLPVDIKDGAILHAGPIIRPLGGDQYEMVTVGPTTSMRMENLKKRSSARQACGSSSAKAAWARAPCAAAATTRRSIAYSRLAVPS